jgi:hypothetical protein
VRPIVKPVAVAVAAPQAREVKGVVRDKYLNFGVGNIISKITNGYSFAGVGRGKFEPAHHSDFHLLLEIQPAGIPAVAVKLTNEYAPLPVVGIVQDNAEVNEGALVVSLV